jgi:hypothetical protein
VAAARPMVRQPSKNRLLPTSLAFFILIITRKKPERASKIPG